MNTKLVAFFSASGVTRTVAEAIAKIAQADLYEIKPEVPYLPADLDWNDEKARSTIEMHDKAFRPAIADKNAHIEAYDTIFLGFPMWWFVAPTIINTFLESYDFAGKKIVLFATSLGSELDDTRDYLKESVDPSATIIDGRVISAEETPEQLSVWLDSLKL